MFTDDGKYRISVVICTFNRAELLDQCLGSLGRQNIASSVYEVIVVDNNSTDTTTQVVARHQRTQANLRYLMESEQGLSRARNRGFRAAEAAWVIFLDDDAKAPYNFIERAIYVTENFDFDCFGGVFLPWYKFGKPRWFQDRYGSNVRHIGEVGTLGDGYASGGIICFKKIALERYGGFPVNIGMSGGRIAYGEENYLQKKIREDGGIIGFDPDWTIEHLVNDYKLTPWWFVASYYASGRDSVEAYNLEANLFGILCDFCSALLFLLVDTCRHSLRLRLTDYYIENIVVDVIGMFAWKIGSVVGRAVKLCKVAFP